MEEIINQANNILKNLDLKVIKILKGEEKNSYSVLLKDENNKIELWFDLWETMEEMTGDWNAYIFDLNNSKDLLIKYIQENPIAYEMAFDLSINALEKFEYKGE